MKKLGYKLATVAVGALLTATTLTACGGNNPPAASGNSSSGPAVKIGLLLPETKTTRYEAFDRPLFEAKIKSLGNYDVVYSNASQDASKQQEQAESALTDGVKVLVLDPVNAQAAASIVASAKAQDVPVISYDRLVAGTTDLAYYISFDNEQVGVLQGNALVDKLAKDGIKDPGILMVNGSPTDGNAVLFKKGAHSVIDKSDVKVLAEYDTPDWSPDKAQSFVAGQITQFTGQIDGVYAANDGTAGGAVAALKAANVTPWPVITGQDAEITGIQRIVSGDQYMTIYKAIKTEAELAATVADQLAKGETPTDATDVAGVPTKLLTPVVVTKENIMDTVVKDGFYTVAQICTAEYAKACAAANIK
ncbi:sugar ABC transporter substrate-binding protein [Paeniglutamicibacter psychrophenolicus]|uniref:sugar ABC transporter substrate-binding protein n=1 Tax=Paeniglutamicibacter psychrophenolicus TaxID=257454 RepID=UPI0027874EAD|nr:sugar ABC transporter substrate-binding protein [Paeniglutamicibacter psychrophenolicus]MDQ0096064.1 D-xylose transport system substrate-binding protein [Paeniglutamicibacter psychrophenolicus]